MRFWITEHKHSMQRLAVMLLAGLSVYSCGGGGATSVSTEQSPDAVVQDLPIAYVKRIIPVDEQGNAVTQNLREPVAFNAGAELILRDLASPTASETILTNELFAVDELYDVKDLEVSSDGNKLIFALRAPLIDGLDDDEQPTWNIWQYEIDSQLLSRIITSDLTAEGGQDFAPSYLPDGRIVFSSTRQRSNKSTLLDEGKPQFSGLEENRQVRAAVLHIMDADGNNIKQITFNQSHDLDPTVMSDGRIVFTRWDNMGNRNGFNLYRVNPDGSHMEFLYGNHSHMTGTNDNRIEFTNPREMAGGQLLTMTHAAVSSKFSGDITQIDTINYTENDQLVFAGAGSTNQAQLSLTSENVSNDDSVISEGGYYSSAFPLWDGTDRLLVSWSACRLTEMDQNNNPVIVACTESRLADPAAIEAQTKFGIWIYDLADQTMLPIVTGEEGYMYSEAVALQNKTPALYIPDGVAGVDLEQTLVDENVGVIHIRSVYDFDGVDVTTDGIDVLADPQLTLAAQRPARFLRLVKAVSMPDDDLVDLDGSAFGRSRGQLMREILGYVPIEPDGSVKFKVPANVAFAISILDKQGRRITERHQNWLQVTPGQQLECVGCHSSVSEVPHGRMEAESPSINFGAMATGVPFPNTEPALFADQGESMAETYTRINGVREPSVNIVFDDEWTDETVRAKDPSFAYQYLDLQTASPTSINCLSAWSSNCRIIVNYPDVIQPLWELPRITYDVDGFTVLSDNTCTRCHSTTDEIGLAQIPDAQLDLSSTTSIDEPDHLTSYRELLFSDNEQELSNAALIDRLVPSIDAQGNPVYETDIDGNLILDALGNPIPVMVNVGVSPALNVAGALTSPRLFNLLETSGTHFGMLTDAEIKLIAEWLDIGGQYYNNPFDVPPN